MNKAILKILGQEYKYIPIQLDNLGNYSIHLYDGYDIEKIKIAVQKLNIKILVARTKDFSFLKHDTFWQLEEFSGYYSHQKPLSENNIKLLYQLTQLKKLYLNIENPHEFDFSCFPKLTHLSINFPKKPVHFNSLTNLIEITVNQLNTTNLSDFTTFRALQVLNLQNTTITNLDGIEQLNNLKKIVINDAPNLNDMEAISSLSKNLKALELGSCKELNILQPIEHLKALTELYLHHFERINDLAFLEKLPNLNDLSIYQVQNINSLVFLTKLNELKSLFVTPWDVIVADNSYLPLTQKLIEMNKLTQIIEWEDVIFHLDEVGKKMHYDYFNLSKLQIVKRDFNFQSYDGNLPVIVEIYDTVNEIVLDLIETLEKSKNATKSEKLELLKTAVLKINTLDDISNDDFDGFDTTEREILSDAFDNIAYAIGIEQYINKIANKYKTW